MSCGKSVLGSGSEAAGALRRIVEAQYSRPVDPILTLACTQCLAIVSNLENRNPFTYADLLPPYNPSATTDRTLVMSRSAVRVRSSALQKCRFAGKT